MNQIKSKNNYYISLTSLIIISLLFHGCKSRGTQCADMPAESCRELVAMHETVPGELLDSDIPVQIEIRNGEKGIWIGTDTFRVIIEQDLTVKKTGSESLIGTPFCEIKASIGNKAEQKMINIFREIYRQELTRKKGMINQELSLIAFDKEVQALTKTIIIVQTKQTADTTLTVFQVKLKCLKKQVYAGNISCD